ncbi:MAG: hypothetical protein ACTHJ0_04010 [Flavipsychrobacter sp.]
MPITCMTVMLTAAPRSLTSNIIGWTISTIISAFFTLVQYRILCLEAPQNRKTKPALVWLTIIPYAFPIFQFYFTKQVSDSITRQLSASGQPTKKHPTLFIGYAYCAISLVFNILDAIIRLTPYENKPMIRWLLLFWLISFITYWVRLGAFKRKLQANSRLTAQPIIAP